MRVERSGQIVQVRLAVNHREVGGADERTEAGGQAVCDFQMGSLGSLPASQANDGAAGVDEQSIEEFERDLKGNLYKLWNRLSSGSYFPAPVRAVEIPKRHGQGGVRILGVPTVST